MKIRVLEVLPTLRRAGAEQVAVSLARGLDRAVFDTAVVSLYNAFPNGLEPLLEEAAIPTRHLGKRRGFDPRMWPRLARVFRELKPSVIHTHSYVLRYSLPAAGSRPVVHTIHNLADKDADGFGRWVNRLAFRRGVLPVAAGEAIAKSFREVYGFDAAATIPNGVELVPQGSPGNCEAWRKARGFGSDDVLIVSAARLDEQKNPLGLIDAFARGLAADSRCHLLLLGGGALEGAARERAAGLGIAGRVHFFGTCACVGDVLSAADVFALASRWEGRPLAVMEAMAARLPVVATAVGGVPELVEEGVSGLLVPANNPDRLAEALAVLARDPEKRTAMGRAAGARAESWSVEAMVSAYASLFERVARRAS